MKTYGITFILCLHAIVCFAELHEPDGILSTSEALLYQDVNARRTTRIEHADIQPAPYQPQESLLMPEIISFQQALYPVVYYQPPAWQVQAWRQHQAAMRFAASYPPASAMFPIFEEPEPTPRPTVTPAPTATPQPTPTPVVQRVIEERVIVYVTPTPTATATPDGNAHTQEIRAQQIEKLTAEREKARQDAILWLSVLISFSVGVGITFLYLFTKKED